MIDYQSGAFNVFKWILDYQDYSNKLTILCTLKNKCASEVALHLIVDVFLRIGAPLILQSDNGREFDNKIVEEIKKLWPGMSIIHGKTRHSQSQGSVERVNGDVKHML